MTWVDMNEEPPHKTRTQLNVLHVGNCGRTISSTRPPLLRDERSVEVGPKPNCYHPLSLSTSPGCGSYDTNNHHHHHHHHDTNTPVPEKEEKEEEEEEQMVKQDEVKDIRPTWDYVQKKTLGGGLLNVSLLLNNAMQLKTLCSLEDGHGDKHKHEHGFWVVSLALVLISIILQLVVTGLLAKLALAPVRNEANLKHANRDNNTATLLMLAIIIINVFIFAFGMAGGSSPLETMKAV